MNKTPEFYKNISGDPSISRLANGSEVITTNLPVIKTVKTEFVVDVFGTFQTTITHDLGDIYEPFVRVREKGETSWHTLPSYTLSPTGGTATTIRVQNITGTSITLEFESINNNPTYEVEIYFISFKL
jgi:hypothetical protein